MATDENPDDVFAALTADLDIEEPTDVVDVTRLSDVALSDLFADTREKLFAMGEMASDLENTFGTEPGSPEARALHSTRLACIMEMRKRGLL